MNTLMDLVGSFIIGGLLLLIILAAQLNLVENASERNMDLIVQESMATLVEILQHDVRKAGFGVPDSVDAMAQTDSSSVTFFADLEADGSIDTVSYWVSDTTAASGTGNPRDYLFYRRVNAEPLKGMDLGVTNFRLTYLDSSDSQTTVPAQVRAIEIALTVESIHPYGDWYASSSWEGTIRPRNLDMD